MRYNLGMNHTSNYTKKEAQKLFGGAENAAKALGYTGAASAHNWPPVLSEAVSDRVRGAALRLGLLRLDLTPDHAPAPRPYYKLPETLSERDSLAVLGAVFLQQQRQPRPTVTCTWSDGLTKLVRGGRSA